jgi:beta-galactosidase
VLFGPRSGSKTRHFAIPDNLPPGPLASLVPIRVLEVASLRPGLRDEVSGSATGAAERWRERIEATGAIEIDARFEDGDPALVRAGRWSYLACWPDATLLANVMLGMAAQAGLPVEPLPEGVRLRRRGHLTFAFNYGDAVYRTPPSATQFLLGGAEVGPSEVAIWRT